MPNITTNRADITEKPILHRLFQLYLYEFTRYEPEDIGDDGMYSDRYFDQYWIEEERHPFIVRVDGKLAGFVLVRHVMENEQHPWSIAEFFIMHKYRRMGVGTHVAHSIFDRFGPFWEVCQVRENAASVDFWLATIEAYTGGDFTHHPNGHGYWTQGPCQHFRNRVAT